MSEIIEERKGCCLKFVDRTERQIIRLYFWSQVICLLPFFITDLATCYTAPFDECLFLPYSSSISIDLKMWLQIDGFVKFGVFFIVGVITCFDTQAMSRSYVTCSGNLIRIFYLFNFAWTILGSIIFWGNSRLQYTILPIDQPGYLYCGAPFRGYIFFLLIFSYLIIPINLYISSLRPKSQLRTQMLTGSARAASAIGMNVQLIEKPKANYNIN